MRAVNIRLEWDHLVQENIQILKKKRYQWSQYLRRKKCSTMMGSLLLQSPGTLAGFEFPVSIRKSRPGHCVRKRSDACWHWDIVTRPIPGLGALPGKETFTAYLYPVWEELQSRGTNRTGLSSLELLSVVQEQVGCCSTLWWMFPNPAKQLHQFCEHQKWYIIRIPQTYPCYSR